MKGLTRERPTRQLFYVLTFVWVSFWFALGRPSVAQYLVNTTLAVVFGIFILVRGLNERWPKSNKKTDKILFWVAMAVVLIGGLISSIRG